MDCLRSFTLTSSGSTGTSTVTTSSIFQWVDRYGTMSGFNALITLNTGTQFFPRGFKNINLHGIRVNAYICASGVGGGGYGVVNQWNTDLSIVGQRTLLGGTIPAITPGTPIAWSQTNATGFFFSNFTNYLDLPSPIQSVSEISWQGFQIEGFAPTLLGLNPQFEFDYAFNFTFYYKFEGE